MKRFRWFWLMALFASLLGACARPVDDNLDDRNKALGGSVGQKAHYYEARSINDFEIWKDRPKIVFWYWTNQNGELIQQFTCKGWPFWSTESLEPNHGQIVKSSDVNATRYDSYVPPDPGEQYGTVTDELAGRDGTFGEPGLECICMTVQNYPVGSPPLWNFPSGVPLTFNAEGKRNGLDFLKIRLLAQAQAIIDRNGCFDPDAFDRGEVIESQCVESVQTQAPPVPGGPPSATPAPVNP